METRVQELGNQAKSLGREAKEVLREKAGELTSRTKAMGSAALHSAQSAYHVAQEKTIACAHATDAAIRSKPYQAIGIAFGVGLLIGFLIKRK